MCKEGWCVELGHEGFALWWGETVWNTLKGDGKERRGGKTKILKRRESWVDGWVPKKGVAGTPYELWSFSRLLERCIQNVFKTYHQVSTQHVFETHSEDDYLQINFLGSYFWTIYGQCSEFSRMKSLDVPKLLQHFMKACSSIKKRLQPVWLSSINIRCNWKKVLWQIKQLKQFYVFIS